MNAVNLLLIYNKQKSGLLLKDLFAFVGLSSIFFLIYSLNTELFKLLIQTMSDAYLGVTVFVAATLILYHFSEVIFKKDLIKTLQQHKMYQVPISALLGALPGCGGAVIVVTQYVKGRLTFGSFVAVLISTMGDASFLLLAQRPKIALLVFTISLIAGTLFGYLIDFIHKSSFAKGQDLDETKESTIFHGITKGLSKPYLLLLVPGLALGILQALQYDINQLFGAYSIYEPATLIGFTGAILSIMFWINRPQPTWQGMRSEEPKDPNSKIDSQKSKTNWDAMIAETSFVSVWVILGFILFELSIYIFGLDLGLMFKSLGILTPLFAILIGFIPGCGPQILVTSLYLAGVIPLSAQMANAIANDGDALFPALALTPKAAMLATVYSAIPAFIIGYLFYFSGY